MKQKTYVRVAGKEVALISEDDPAYLRRVAAYVDRKLNETAAAMRMSVPSAPVLTAIALGAELMRAQDENQRLRRELLALREQAAQKKEP